VENWFNGKVTGIKNLKENKLKTEFNVVYDVEPDEVWFFPLLMDLKNGDLIVM